MNNTEGRSKEWRKKKWKGIMLNPSNIDEYIKDLRMDTKGQYITQGVSFNKDDALQMNLLKQTLLTHGTFSGFIKHLLYSYFANQQQQQSQISVQQQIILQQNGENELHDESVLDYGEDGSYGIKSVSTDVAGLVEVNEEVKEPEIYVEETYEERLDNENIDYTPTPEVVDEKKEPTVRDQRKRKDKLKGMSKFLESNPNAKKPT